ncbi:OLC1v1038398C1 [Oldenlandia corymbosa var. corymbosa]|uniref:OLC1v1038398C1 n=1 Tax=Oldenlandia corymbosa var. corymbosa TaxID=529605 RepID=A0AAV1D2D2_OLDCO|nr:OLC1v1038398C1 [Oldenlandia corymbosa var. corymbosa]
MDGSSKHISSLRKLFTFAFLLIIIITLDYNQKTKVSANDVDDAVVCSTDLSSFLPLPYSNLPNMVCKRLWNSFVIRYSKTEDHLITVLLSATYTTGWVGIGFSSNGMMLNSSCMVGWINIEGRARIKQYYVEGFTPSAIKPDKGELPLTSVPPYVALHGATIYLAFQLKYASHHDLPKRQPILLAYSTAYPLHHHLTIHDDKTALVFDFSSSSGNTGSLSSGGIAASFYRTEDMKKAHGVLSLLGWGLFLPIGVICGRYLRHREPLWYYVHVVIEFIGFILGVAAAVIGISLNNKLHVHVVGHKTIGVFVLVLSILQVIAFFARPSKDSKKRRYWNWYHHWTGRLVIFLAVTNVFLGIHVGDAGPAWKIAYGILLGLGLISCIILEALTRMKRFDQPEFPHPTFQMNSM